jgi:iron complex transport system substrate-binding protein
MTRRTILILLAGLALAGCGARDATRVELLERFDPPLPELSFTEAPPASAPRRIVSLIPSCTEYVFALGLGERLVGVDRWADFPPSVRELDRLGDLNKVEIERILNKKPDLVIAFQAQRDAAEQLRRAGIATLIPPTEEGDRIDQGVLALAEALGVRARGEALVAHIRAEIERARARVAGKQRPRAVVVFDRQPSFSVATRSSFVHAMIEAAGAENLSAGADPKKHFAYVSLEQILDWRPDMILDLSVGVGDGVDAEGATAFWSRAGVRSRVLLVPSPVLARPGPRMGMGVTFLAKLFHGE